MAFLPSIRRGPALMVLAALCFTGMMALVKVARADMSAFELIFWRSWVTVPVAWWFARGNLAITNRAWMVARAVLGFGAMIGFFTAAWGLPLTTLTLISKLQPLTVALLAPWLLGSTERIGPEARLALALGLVGCAAILGPELGSGSLWGLAALGATLSSAGAHTCLRALGRTERPAAVVFWFQLAVAVLAGLTLLASGGIGLPPSHRVAHVVGIGVLAVAGQLWMTAGYQQDQAAVVAAAGYTAPLWSVLLDLAVFGELPGPLAWLGGALVIAAGLLLLRGRAVPAVPAG